MPDRMPEDMSDRMPKDMPDRMPEDLPDRMPEDMLDRMPNRMSEDMSDRMPEDLPVRKCINVMVGITRSKVICFFIGHVTTESDVMHHWVLGHPIFKHPQEIMSHKCCTPTSQALFTETEFIDSP